MYANEETIQAIIDETLLRIPDKEEHKQFWKNTCIDITNFENKSIEILEPGAYIHYGALDSVYDLFPFKSFNAKRNPETVAILTSCEMFVLEVDRRYKQLRYQLSGGGYVEFTDFACKIFVYNATDIDGDTGNFSRQFDFLWRSSWSSDGEGVSGVKTTIPWYNQNEVFQKYVNDEYVSTLFGYDSIVHKKGSDEYVYSFPEKTGTIALLENIPTKLSDLSNDSGYITIGSVGNGTLTIQKNGTNVTTFSANQSGNSTANITVPTKLSDLTNDTGYITIGSVGNGTLTITQNGTSKGTFSANQSGNSTVDITVPTKTSDLTNDSGYTTNIGTVTQVKVGSTAYNPSSGVVSLPAYPTTLPASDVYAWAKASTKPSYTASEVGALASSTNYASSQSAGGPADTVWGRYTQNGGIQPPNYFGKGKVGFLMSNLSLDSDTHYKNFMYMDNYTNNDVGGVTALAIDRMEARAWILQSDANRTAWNNTAELITKTNLQNQSLSKSQVTTALGFTPGTGTVTQVKVGSTAYNPSSGIVSLPAYPTTLPASDVYSWAKASTKPSYSYSEISGTPTIPTSANYLERGAWWSNASGQNVDDLRDGIHFVYSSHGAPVNGTLVTFSGEGAGASPSPGYCWQMILGYGNGTTLFVRNHNGDASTWGVWRRMARADEIPTKLSELTNDSGYITSSGSCANADTLQNSAPDEGTGASTIVKRTSTGQVKAVYYNMSGEEDNINSFTSNVAFVSSDGWIRKTSKANFSTWLLTWTKLGSTTGNTQLSYTGTYTEFFVILDLGFYAETFYFVASALGAGRHFFGGTTNTSDGSSWVLRASRSNSTYYFEVDRVHQDGKDYTSQVNVSVYAR